MPGKRSTPKRRSASRQSRLLPIIGGVVLVVAAATLALVLATRRPGDISGVQHFSGLSRAHVSGPIKYPQTPPVGGPHDPVWLNCGVYDYPVRAPYAVHSLEHGAVWVTYRPSLPAAQIATLRKLVSGQPYAILSPYPGIPAAVVVVAWGLRLELPSANDPRLKAFIDKYADGPQTPEPGAPCSGGIG